MENYPNFKNIYSGMLVVMWAFLTIFEAEAAQSLSPNQDRLEPTGVTLKQSIETNDQKTYLIEQRNEASKRFKNLAMTLYHENGPFYLRLDESNSSYWKKLHPGESGSWFMGDDVVIDYKYDRTDPNITYIETLFTTFEENEAKGDSNSRWQKFYEFLAREYHDQSSDNSINTLSFDLNSKKEKSDLDEKSDSDERDIFSSIRHLDFGKFTSKEISLKPLEIILRFKNKSNSDDNEKDTRFFQDLYLQESKLNQSGFTEDSFYQKSYESKSDSSEASHSEGMFDALKAIFGLDMQAIKQYLNEFQKLTETITRQELVNLRPFYEALAKLIQETSGVDIPQAPTLENEVSPEENEWRKELDRLAYAILIGENTAVNGPDKTQLVSFRARYHELFKTYVLPVKQRYNDQMKASLEEFLNQLKDLLANKTAQVVVKTTRDSTEFVLDVAAKE